MYLLPSLVVPKVLSFKNRWRTGIELRTQFGRDVVLGAFSLGIMLAMYGGIIWTLNKMQEQYHLAYLHPSTVLGLIGMALFMLLIFSSAVAALGALYLGQDLDLVMAAPISKPRFFFGKLAEITGSATWMVLVFGIPIVCGFGHVYHQGLSFYLTALLASLPFFAIPPCLAIIAVGLFTSIVPANRTRDILIVAGGVGVIGVYFFLKLLQPDRIEELSNINALLQIISIVQLPNSPAVPSYWAATIIGDQLDPLGRSMVPYWLASYCAAGSLMALAYIVFRTLHEVGYTKARISGHGTRIDSRVGQKVLRALTPFIPADSRAMLSKEISVFLRDMTQTIQLMLLLGLCTVYLYNLRILRVVEELPDSARTWWQAFLVIGNMAMGAFVIAAVCTRFVFPTISLEGRAYWILRSSPMPLKALLRTKFWIWLVPVATIGSIILTSGAFAINAEPHIVIVSGLISWVVCYGIVGLGIGLGAVYAQFDWEQPSQLAASFGSLVYMIASTTLIAVSLVPTTVIILLRSMRVLEHEITTAEWYIAIGSCALLLIYINYAVTRWALAMGEHALLEREK